MQAVSSSYQLEDAKVAISGNLKYQSAQNSGLDFSKILKDISISQSDRVSKESSPPRVLKRELPNRDSSNERSGLDSSGRKDSIDSKADRPEINSKREEVRLESKPQREEVISRREQPENIKDKETVSSVTELSDNSKKTVGVSECESESVQVKDNILLSADTSVSQQTESGASDRLSQLAVRTENPEIILVSEKVASDSLEELPEVKLQNLNIFTKVSELAQENGIDLTVVDPKILNELVYKMSANPLTDFDTKAFEDAAVQFLKGDIQALKTFMVNDGSSEIQQFSAAEDVMSMLRELDGTVKVNDEKPLFSMTEDFGAKDFEVIEDSIRASLNLDEILAKEDIKTKIESILADKKESLQNSLEKSVELLKKVVNTSVSEASVNNEVTSSRVDAFAVNPRNLTENSLGINSQNLMSKSFSEQGSSSMFSQSNPNLYSSLNTSGKTVDGFTLSGADAQKFDLLNMSSDLKENAKALAMKVMEMSSRNLKSLELALNPEGLGKMRIVIDAASPEEITKISISASHSGTRAMLESGIDVLKNLLESNSIFAKTEVSEYGEERAFNGSSSEEFSQNSGQNQKQQKENEENQSDNGTIFAGGKIDAEASENHHIENNENLNNSQNSNTVSYFA